jgi:importin subunit beta-1
MADLTSLLLATQDPNTRAQAEAKIKEAETNNVEEYFKALAQELAGEEKPKIARQLSGLLLKNALAAKDPSSNQEKRRRWAALPSGSRELVKQATTKALIAPDLDVGKAAAQVLAKIGSVEIPVNEWPGLVPLLLNHVTNQDARARQVSLICLGYLCEDLVILAEEGTQVADEISNHILTAVAQGMRDADVNIKLEATRAFYHSVVLAHKNFSNQQERDFIMQVVTDACNTKDSEAVQAVAFECLVQIATEYYQYVMAYMPVIGDLLFRTIRGSSEKVAMPAMEFWSTVCDEELYITELVQAGQQGDKQLFNIIQQALPHLIPLLTEMLTRQQSEEDDDTWNLAMASGSCLGLVAQVVGDQCVDLVLQFVQANFENADWKFREAAILAYGSIMEGPSSEKMRPMVAGSYQHLVQRLGDQSIAVRDTLAWTLGRIVQFHPAIVPVKEMTPQLGQALNDVPRVATNICWVLQVLSESMDQNGMPGQAPPSTPLSEFFTPLAEALIRVTARPDATERNLRMAAYNSLAALISKAGNDCLQYMGPVVVEMLRHLEESFKIIDKECEVQGYICGVLNAAVTRLRQQIAPKADEIMESAIKVMTVYVQVKGGAQVLHEEALLLVQTLAFACAESFDRYMTVFGPHLKAGLENYDDVQVCYLSVGILGDLSRILERKLIKYCDTFLEILYQLLMNSKVDRKIKAAIMPVFGDVALAIAGDFEKYLAPVLQMLHEASKTKLPADVTDPNDDWVDYLNSLREGVMQGYTGIIHGLKDANKLDLLKAHVNNLITFVTEICNDKCTNEDVLKATLGVLGDVIFAFQQELVVHLQTPQFSPCLQNLVQFAARTNDPRTQQTGQWLQSLLQRYS